jgi:hypothetical protein
MNTTGAVVRCLARRFLPPSTYQQWPQEIGLALCDCADFFEKRHATFLPCDAVFQRQGSTLRYTAANISAPTRTGSRNPVTSVPSGAPIPALMKDPGSLIPIRVSLPALLYTPKNTFLNSSSGSATRPLIFFARPAHDVNRALAACRRFHIHVIFGHVLLLR